jgi:hypothetical protein
LSDLGVGEEGISKLWIEAGVEDETKENFFDSLTVFANNSSMSEGLFTLDFTFNVTTFAVLGAPLCPTAATFDAAAPAVSIALAFGVAPAFGVEAATVSGAATVADFSAATAAFGASTIFFLLTTFAHFPTGLT